MFGRKQKRENDEADAIELKKTLSAIKIIALNLQKTADEFEKQIEDLKEQKKVQDNKNERI